METIKVNMNPNPLDVQTIHASQNDSEARQWGFELHNNGDVIDASEITDQIVFKAYEGGTEQLLPENGSTPTTSPFKGDIRYPQGLLTDQEFTYRQSPTEKDGNAKIESLYGNTLVWNQLVQNITGTTASGWVITGGTATISGDTISYTATSVETDGSNRVRTPSILSLKNGHKYIYSVTHKESKTGLKFAFSGFISTGYVYVDSSTSWVTSTVLITETQDKNWAGFSIRKGTSDVAVGDTFDVKNSMIIDLTQMFGSGNEPTIEEFNSLFPLPYYAYDSGSLLSFNGNGIKTVGKNLFSGEQSYTRTSTGYYIREGNTNNPIPLKLAKGTYTISIKSTVSGISQLELFSGGIASSDRYIAPYISLVAGVKTYTFTIERQADYIRLYGNFVGTISDIQIEFGSTATDYEPYTSSTLSLPISTYFPTGMKSARDVYDELTESKAITRVGAVDLGTLSWTYRNDASATYFSSVDLNNVIKKPATGSRKANILCPRFTTMSQGSVYAKVQDKIISAKTEDGTLWVYDTSYTSASDFKSAMSGVYLYYELATPTETEFTTATLVTENGEVALANEDGVLVGRCNSDISADAGFIEGKIKLSDEDGDVYSNKIQIHVERSPQ